MEVMLDLETMGNAPAGAIVSIGAVAFDDKKVHSSFYSRVNLEYSVKKGMTIDPSTVLWWLQQDKLIQEDLQNTSGQVNLNQALASFSAFCKQVKVSGIWGNGVNFDNTILRSAYNLCDLTPPWHYRQDRCFRTVKALYPVPMDLAPNTEKHNALSDATWQAEYLIALGVL